MAIPEGYVKIQPNTLYENVEYYIDTSVNPSVDFSVPNGVSTPFITKVLNGSYYSLAVNVDINGSVETRVVAIVEPSYKSWQTVSEDGLFQVLTGFSGSSPVFQKIESLNIRLTVSPDWLYVKPPVPEYIAEPLYLESELQASKAVEVTGNGSVTVQPDSGFVAVKEVVVTTNVQGGDYVMSEVANATGTTVVFTYAGSGYTVTLTSDSQSTASSSSVAYTYLSTTQPTSASDYDYELLGTNKLYDNSESTTALTQPVTFNATELWIWGYGYKINGGSLVTTSNVYTSATHITLSQNTAIALVNEYYSPD